MRALTPTVAPFCWLSNRAKVGKLGDWGGVDTVTRNNVFDVGFQPFHPECKLRFSCVQHILQQMQQTTNLSVSIEAKYWVSWSWRLTNVKTSYENRDFPFASNAAIL